MSEFEGSACWLCMYCYVIDAYRIGCKMIDQFGFCPFDHYRDEDKKDDAEADR